MNTHAATQTIRRTLFAGLYLLLLGIGLTVAPTDASAKQRKTRTKQIASYEMHVTLDPRDKMIRGWQILTWHNDSNDSIRHLWFHLYMNAFKNERSIFMREWRVLGRLGGFTKRMRKGGWGWTHVKKMQIVGGPELTQRIQFAQVDGKDKEDRTVIKVSLPKPLGPQQTIRLRIDFDTRMPYAFARSGHRKNYFFAAQWFPKIGVYEKAGVRGAKRGRWNCHAYHATSEYYADYGTYTAHITVPSEYIVGATGARIRTRSDLAKKTTTYTYHQSDVHDFTWTAYPHYKRVVKMFRASRDVDPKERALVAKRLGRPPASLKLHDVKMIFLMQPEHLHLLDRHVKALKQSLAFYGLRFGAYPYSTITLVDPIWEGSDRGFSGMEYATLFTAGTRRWVAKDDRRLEYLIVHEFGHQFFQGILASNEFEEAWLDEGINSYVNHKFMKRHYPHQRLVPRILHLPFPSLSIPLKPHTVSRAGFLFGSTQWDAVATPSWKFQSAASYGKAVYAKASIVMHTLERVLGADTMAKVMRKYAETWRFRHPSSQDFVRVVNKTSKRNMNPFFQQFLFGTRELDYAVADIWSTRVKKPRGIFAPSNPFAPKTRNKPKTPKAAKTHKAHNTPQPSLTPKPSTQASPTSAPSRRKAPATRTRAAGKQGASGKKSKKKKTLYRSYALIRRKGDAIWPVEIAFVFSDGKRMEKRWDGKHRWIRYHFERPAKLVSVTVDPKHKLWLDVNTTNNSMRKKAHSKTSVSWAMRLLFWLQHILQLLVSFS